MRRGRGEQAASSVDIYEWSATPFVVGFAGAPNLVHGSGRPGDPIFAELSNEELDGIEAGDHVYARLRDAQVFPGAGDAPAGPCEDSLGPVAARS